MKPRITITINNLSVFAIGIGTGILMANLSGATTTTGFVYLIVGVIAISLTASSIIRLMKYLKGGTQKNE